MELHEKIKFMRMFKGWSQEEIAEKLGMTVNGYAKIEKGETDTSFSRLQQISALFGIELPYLIGLSEKNVINLIENRSHYNPINIFTSEAIELKHEIEKLRLIVEQKDREISYLKEIINLTKDNPNFSKS